MPKYQVQTSGGSYVVETSDAPAATAPVAAPPVGTPAPQPTAGGVTMTLPAGGGVATTPPRTAPLRHPAAAPASGLEQTSQFATGFDNQMGSNLVGYDATNTR